MQLFVINTYELSIKLYDLKRGHDKSDAAVNLTLILMTVENVTCMYILLYNYRYHFSM